MAEAKLAPNLPDWMVKHANRYIASGGTDGHMYKINVPGRGEITAPSLLLTTPTLTDPTLAPEGRHLQYLLAPCPNLDSAAIRWDAIAHRYASELVEEMSARKLLVDPEPLAVITPDDWARDGQAAGTPFSAAHTFGQTGPFRPGNLPFRDGNVVLAGSGTTPGVGIPPVLISGRLAAGRLRRG